MEAQQSIPANDQGKASYEETSPQSAPTKEKEERQVKHIYICVCVGFFFIHDQKYVPDQKRKMLLLKYISMAQICESSLG